MSHKMSIKAVRERRDMLILCRIARARSNPWEYYTLIVFLKNVWRQFIFGIA